MEGGEDNWSASRLYPNSFRDEEELRGNWIGGRENQRHDNSQHLSQGMAFSGTVFGSVNNHTGPSVTYQVLYRRPRPVGFSPALYDELRRRLVQLQRVCGDATRVLRCAFPDRKVS
ncbi:hypothetical protein ABZX65_07230 [Streptomyces sp. NPDC003300]|uniref:hypothetical protein n=1 Tax=unclassified Streptomyces TaxID=2593676 RepID=UPI0033BA6DED